MLLFEFKNRTLIKISMALAFLSGILSGIVDIPLPGLLIVSVPLILSGAYSAVYFERMN